MNRDITLKIRSKLRGMKFLPLLVVFALLMGGCRTKAVIPFPGNGGSGGDINVVMDKNFSTSRKRVVEVSHEWIGTPYKYAHAEKGIASDCSGMVMCVFEEAISLKIPRNSAKQAEYCLPIKEKDVKPGDLVFFATGSDPERISHVGIMLDGDNFIHVSSSKGTCISTIRTPYFSKALRSFGRLPDFD